jgi:hypothetical protein
MRPGTLRAEDLALAGWNLVALPVAAALGGEWSSSEPAPLLGLVELLAVVGAIVALATRTPDAPPLHPESFRGWAMAGPLIGGVALVGDSASDRLGLDVAGLLGPAAFIAIVAAFVLADRLPVLGEGRRRLLVAPFVFVAAGFFGEFMASLLDGLDLGELAGSLFGGAGGSEVATIAGLVLFAVVAGSAAFYAMLVVAPRELASPEPRPVVWAIRFVLFLATSIIGVGGWLIL